MTINEIYEEEPLLEELEYELRKLNFSSNMSAYDIWYYSNGGMNLRGRMRCLVGWGANNKSIATADCYDVVYRHFAGILGI
jgi:hypothetical protein